LNGTPILDQLAGWLPHGRRASAVATPEDFAAFFEHTHQSVFRYVYGLGGGPQENAEDLTAEAFARAWKARPTFRGDAAAALGWVLQIARNLVIDDIRRLQQRPEAALDDTGDLLSSDPPPEARVIAEEQRQALLRMLQELSAEPREILVLRYLVGWRVNQIARYLGIPENSVSVSIHRSLERMKRRWSLD